MAEPIDRTGLMGAWARHPFIVSGIAATIPVVIAALIGAYSVERAARITAQATLDAVDRTRSVPLPSAPIGAEPKSLAREAPQAPNAPPKGVGAYQATVHQSNNAQPLGPSILVANERVSNDVFNFKAPYTAGSGYDIQSYSCWRANGDTYCGFYIHPSEGIRISAAGKQHTHLVLKGSSAFVEATILDVQANFQAPEWNAKMLQTVSLTGGGNDEYTIPDEYREERLFLLFRFPGVDDLRKIESVVVNLGGNDVGVKFPMKYIGK